SGLEYHYDLVHIENGTNTFTNNYTRRDQWWFRAGIGADIKLSHDWYLTPAVYWIYDLTVWPYYDTRDFRNAYGESVSQWASDNNFEAYAWALIFSIGAE